MAFAMMAVWGFQTIWELVSHGERVQGYILSHAMTLVKLSIARIGPE